MSVFYCFQWTFMLCHNIGFMGCNVTLREEFYFICLSWAFSEKMEIKNVRDACTERRIVMIMSLSSLIRWEIKVKYIFGYLLKFSSWPDVFWRASRKPWNSYKHFQVVCTVKVKKMCENWESEKLSLTEKPTIMLIHGIWVERHV